MSKLRPTGIRLAIVGAIAAISCACSDPSTEAPAAQGGADAEAAAKSAELKRVIDRMMAPPQIRTEPGFSARLLIVPGESPLYDPLALRVHEGTVWVADDGGLDGDKGGQILAIDPAGKVSDILPLGSMIWVHSFDIAPASFAPYQGHIFVESAMEAGTSGQQKEHTVQRVDLAAKMQAETVCVLPPAGGPDGKGRAIGGGDTRFGPDGSPFAGKFFAVISGNRTVYQVTPDGSCTPFVSFDHKKWGTAWGLAFTPDGRYMLVSMLQMGGSAGDAIIARVRPDGSVDPEPLVRSGPKKVLNLFGMTHAPEDFGQYAGQLFVAANDARWLHQYEGKYLSDALPESGELYRLTPEGELKLVASGFRGAVGVEFFDNRLWVSDINGDFLGRARELPDGFVVEITATR